VLETDCGRKALDLVEQEAFDLVFLDLQLPDLNGLQVLAAMRERAILTPVVLISAYGKPEIEDSLQQLGCFGFLPKPFTPSEVRIAAARALNEV
jgi:CheY-like chemotaxis protein